MKDFVTIGITGHARSGKDTAAGFLCEHFGFSKLNFADELKEDLIRLDPIVGFDIQTGDLEYLSEALQVCNNDLEEVKRFYPEWRRLCQRYGTDVRRAEDPDIWVNRWMRKVRKLDTPGVVCADVRFPNELGGILWTVTIKIERPEVGAANDHAAEQYIDGFKADITIRNDGDLEYLKKSVIGNVIEILNNRSLR